MANVNPIQLQKFLKGMEYPASKDEVLRKAEENGADDDVRSSLETLPDGETFETPADVSKHLGEA